MFIELVLMLCCLSVFLLVTLKKRFKNMMQNRDFLYIVSSKYIYFSIFVGCFIVPIMQGLWIIMISSHKQDYMPLLYVNTALSIVLFLILCIMFYAKRMPILGIQSNRYLKYLLLNTLFVFVLYITLLPIFFVIFGLLSLLDLLKWKYGNFKNLPFLDSYDLDCFVSATHFLAMTGGGCRHFTQFCIFFA